MHCPACGQIQVSNEAKFCSRCGLPLGIVSEVLAHGGSLPRLAELDAGKRPILTRRNGLAFSLIWLLFFLLILTPLLGILGADRIAGIPAIIGIFGGLIWFVSSLMFLRKDPTRLNSATTLYPQQVPGQTVDYTALPPQQSIPVSYYANPKAGNWRDTNDLQPTSVTEGTTRLLNDEETP